MKAPELRKKALLAISLRWVKPYEYISQEIERAVDGDPYLRDKTFDFDRNPYLSSLRESEVLTKVLYYLSEDGYVTNLIAPSTLQVCWGY